MRPSRIQLSMRPARLGPLTLARRARLALAITSLLAAMVAAPGAGAQDPPGLSALPPPVDPETWEMPDTMTWSDHDPIPGFDWTDPSLQPPKKIRAALILGDFSDQPFIVTQPEGSDLAGNPIGLGDIPRNQVANWYSHFLMTMPQPLNHFHTVNEYWLEDSYGLVGIDADAFGPYRMDFKEYQYGLNEFSQQGDCPEAGQCNKGFDNELLQKSLADVTAGIATNGGRDYDFRFLLHSGYDESGTWQEFGEMKFQTPEDVSEEFGNPNPAKPNFARTRYIPWTSFWAARGIWSHATPGVMSTQGENDGASTYAHEFSHIMGVLDNYNNPYGNPLRRSYSGPWDMLSRGTFNGPGGPHNRWEIPPTLGGTMGSHHMVRNKIRMGFSKPGEVLFLERGALARTGPIVTDVWARAVPVGPGTGRTGLHGIQIAMGSGDQSPPCSVQEDYRCDGGGYNHYTVEVVDRMGYDSFTPDHGVLIAKTKNADLAPFIWVIDSHPEDFNRIDFIRPSGEPAMISKGDYRQLADALFHAGTGEGVVSEFVDTANRLHFYVLGIQRDQQGVLSYRVAVRSLDGSGPYTYQGRLSTEGQEPAAAGRVAALHYRVDNLSTLNGIPAGTDLVRLKAETDKGWETALRHPVVEVSPGGSARFTVFVKVPPEASGPAVVTLTASSEMGNWTAASSQELVPAQ
jgi:M6 family metalloprotease-like protein